MARSQDFFLIVALLACLWYPVRLWFEGGVVRPSLLRKPLLGEVYVITGGNTGIGFETVLQLSKQNATVVFGARSLERGKSALARVKAEVPYARVSLEKLDLASLASVREFAAKVKAAHPSIKALINNAGVMVPPLSYTKDGFESQFGTNVLGHHLLTELLLDTLKAGAPSRIIDVASLAHEQANLSADWDDLPYWKKPERVAKYSSGLVSAMHGWEAYANSKLANMLHARYLANKLKGTGVSAVSLHPGVIATELSRYASSSLPSWVQAVLRPISTATGLKTPWQGTQTTLHTALVPESELCNGCYYSDCAVKEVRHKEFTDANAERLYQLSSKLVGLSVAM